MTTKTSGRPRTSETHDLREDLLRTNHGLSDEGRPTALSTQEVARYAGCAHRAPYHYFANHETILTALVEARFDELANRLREARDKAGTEDLRAVTGVPGNTYVRFALTNPGVFRVVFRRDMYDPARFPGVLAVGKRARDELGRFTQAIIGERATLEHGTVLWTSVHELTVLLLDGLMADELPTLECRLAYARQVNQLGTGALIFSGRSGERGDPGA